MHVNVFLMAWARPVAVSYWMPFQDKNHKRNIFFYHVVAKLCLHLSDTAYVEWLRVQNGPEPFQQTEIPSWHGKLWECSTKVMAKRTRMNRYGLFGYDHITYIMLCRWLCLMQRCTSTWTICFKSCFFFYCLMVILWRDCLRLGEDVLPCQSQVWSRDVWRQRGSQNRCVVRPSSSTLLHVGHEAFNPSSLHCVPCETILLIILWEGGYVFTHIFWL